MSLETCDLERRRQCGMCGEGPRSIFLRQIHHAGLIAISFPAEHADEDRPKEQYP
jgi:hypothetical protein